MCCLLVLALTSYTQTLYWVGESGEWGDQQNWSITPDGLGGASIPGPDNDVVILDAAYPRFITLDQASCRALEIRAHSAKLQISGNNLETKADIELADSCRIDLDNWFIHGQEVRFSQKSAELNTDIIIATHHKFNLESALILMPLHSLTIGEGEFFATNQAILAEEMLVTTDCDALDFENSKLLVNSRLELSDAEVNSQDLELYMASHGNVSDPFSRLQSTNPQPLSLVDCGTGPGETPFSITASVVTDFNGEDISCNGADDGIATVSVSGGIGPFTFQWIGGDAPGFNQTYSNLGAGTYTVLVTDQGQGITCVDNVQLAEPAPIALFQLILSPPGCEGECNGTGFPVAIGGVPGYSFNWSNGETSQSANGLCEGTNTLTISDNNNCVFDSTFTLEIEPIIFNLVTNDVLCNGTATGEASVNPEGGSGGPYDIQWSSGDSGPMSSGLSAGSYTVTVTDAGSCPYDTSFTITEEPLILINEDLIEDESCEGNADGSISIEVSGGSPPFDYAWEGPDSFSSGDEDINNLSAGDYTLTLTDANLCESQAIFSVLAPPPIVLSADITDVICAGETTGAIDLILSGGSPNFTFEWFGPNGFTANTEDINTLEVGSYTVLVQDENGCEETATFDVIEPAPIDVSETLSDPLCTGEANGSIEVEVSGGSPAYTFVWSGPNSFTSGDEDISNLEAGNYSLEVTDSNNCLANFSFELQDPDPISIDVGGNGISCPGEADATIDITVSGGTPSYDFSWIGPSGFTSDQEDIGPLEAGTYTLSLTDAAGCNQDAEVIISEPLPISVTPVITDVSCGGLSDGSIEISVLGGTPDYDFSWIGPEGYTSTEEDISGLIAGPYDLTITDDAACTASFTYDVIEQPPIDAIPIVTDIDCNGAGNGSIDLEINGGVPPYNVSWSGPDGYASIDEDIFDLEAGDYSFEITDSNNCPFIGTAIVIEADPIDVTVNQVDPICAGDTTGSIELLISGGQLPYTVTWAGGFSGEFIDNLPAGTYTPTITDNLACELTLDPIELTTPPAIDISLDITDVLCNGDTTGAINISVTGGTPDYSFEWSGPNGFISASGNLINLEQGAYSLIVTDNEGCTQAASADVTSPEALDISASTTTLVCATDLGSIDLSVSGGVPNYTYEWSGPNGFTFSGEDPSDLEQGLFSVLVTDANDCVGQLDVDLTAPDPISVDAIVTPLDCSGEDNGSIELDIAGGQPPYIINWTGPNSFSSNDEDIFDLSMGSYILLLEDQNGCAFNAEYELSQPPLLSLTAVISPPLCAQENTGMIDITVEGGFPEYVYTWNGPDGFGSPAEDISNLNAGEYTLLIQDQGNCSLDTSFTLTEMPGIIIDATISNIACGGEGSGSIELEITGGAPDYTYLWDGPEGFVSDEEDLFDLEPGTYELNVSDLNSCSVDTIFTISEPDPLELEFTVSQPVCTESNGSIEATVSEGQPTYTYEWFDLTEGSPIAIGANAPLLESLSSGLYQLTVTDANGCQIEDLIPLTDQPLDAEFDINQLLCNGDTTGAIDLTILDGTEPYTINWSGPDGFSSMDEDIVNLSAGEYILSVVDLNDCVINEVLDLEEPDALVLDPEKTDIFCNGGDDGEIITEVFGGVEPYSFSWIGPEAFNSDQQNLSALAPGDYTLVLTDDNGCTEDSTIGIIETTIIDIELNFTEALCFGDNSGTIDLTVNGGTAPYTFDWTGPDSFTANDEDLIELSPGDYSLNLTDANSCSTDTTITISEAPELMVEITAIQPTCGEANGSFDAIVSGGQVSDDYSYIWYDITDGASLVISTSSSVTGLSAGIYFVEIFDDLGCTYSETINLSDQDGQIDATISDVLCFGDNNGTIAITVSGAQEPIQSYDWMGPDGFSSTDQNISDLISGTYTILIEDNAGCSFSDIFEVGSPDLITLAPTISPVSCHGETDAAVELDISGGTPDFNLEWSSDNGFSSIEPSIAELAPDCYTATVTDGNSCVADTTFCIGEPEPIDIIAEITDAECGGEPGGLIDITVSGGTGGYTYNWIGPDGFEAGSEDLNLIFAGSYDVLVLDENNCEATENYFVDENSALNVDPLITNPLCFDDSNGSISLQPSGGIPDLNVDWIGPDGFVANGNELIDLGAGTYEYILSDDIGCFITDSITLTEPDSLSVQILDSDISCFGEGDGSIELDITGGTPDYTVFWTGPNGFSTVSTDIFTLQAGTYEYQLGDSNACTLAGTVQIDEPQELIVDLNNTVNPNCSDSFDGLIDLDVSGGQPDYSFSWTGPDGFTADTEDVEGLGPGLFNVLVSDQGSCSVNIEGIELMPLITVMASATEDTVVCQGIGFIELIGESEGELSSAWLNDLGVPITESDTLAISLDPGDYFFIYEAVNDPCEASDTVFVTVLPAPLADAGNGQFIFPEEPVILGGNPTSFDGNQVLWSPTELLDDSTAYNPTATGILEDQSFIVTVIDEFNCAASDTINVSIIPEIIIPDGFSPNGDNTNDLWQIENVGLYPSITVEIYNRWGDLLWRNIGYTEPWDGLYDGQPLPIGTYYYVIDINEPDFQDEITGPITILR